MLRTLLNFFWLFLPAAALAAESSGVSGVGLVAGNLIEPVSILSDFVSSTSIVVGATALFGAFLKYMQHRVNPLVAPMSTIIVLFIIGVVLVALPLIANLTESGIPYRFHF